MGGEWYATPVRGSLIPRALDARGALVRMGVCVCRDPVSST